MTLYDILVKLAASGYDKIYVDLQKKNIKIGKRTIIENSHVQQYKIKVNGKEYKFDGLIDGKLDIDELYKQYKYSVPSERDMRGYFKALGANEMSDAQLVLGMHRSEAKVRLEAYLALAVITGIETWPDTNKWYWQGKDKDFVVLRKYFEI